MKRILAALLAAFLVLAGSSAAYASDPSEEWGIIPDDYVIEIGPPSQGVFIAPENPGNSTHSRSTVAESGDDFPYTLEEYAAIHLAETNRIREEYGLEPLKTDPVLTEMAQVRMDEYVPGHKRLDGSDWYTIFNEYNVDLKPSGENMASAGDAPINSARGFMETSHRNNVLNENAEYIGIGVKWVETVVGPRIAVLQLYANDA